MAKESLVVSLCAVFIVIGFLASLYLMTTVNPEPIQHTGPLGPPAKRPPPPPKEEEPAAEEAAELMSAPYGLGKVDVDVTDYYTSKRPGSYPNSGRKVVPPIWPRRLKQDMTPTIHKVMPPIWPTTTVATDADASRSIKSDQYDVSTKEETLTSNNSVKSRKSRSNYITHEDLGSIILKILNNTGKSRIEIKLHPKGCYQKKKAKGNKRAKNKPVFIAKPDNDNNYIDNNLETANHTVINVCGNDSIVINDSGDLDILELIKLVRAIASEGIKNNTNNTTDESIVNVPVNKNISDEILTDDNIESLNKITEHIDFNITDVNNINDTYTTESMKKEHIDDVAVTHLDKLNDTTIFDAVLRNSELHITDAHMSSKEFNKLVFDEEEIDSITHKTTLAPKNDTVLISDVTHGNISDLYIENDSDIIY